MEQTRTQMTMPVRVHLADAHATTTDVEAVFTYFTAVEDRFSVFKETSEISRINNGLIAEADYSTDMKEVLALSEETRQLTHGCFDIRARDGRINPSGLVKGWAVYRAARILKNRGLNNFIIDAGGDMEICGMNEQGADWIVSIRNPFRVQEVVKNLRLHDCGVATSGTYLRGQHVYNPHAIHQPLTDVISLTVIGPNAYEADRFATAAFAMGRSGIAFIEALDGFEGYQIDANGIATKTTNFERFVQE